MKLIHAFVDNPRKNLMKMSFGVSKTAKATCYRAYCSNCSQCELYQLGQCIQLNNEVCPYGTSRVETGFTSKAQGFYSSEYDGKPCVYMVHGAIEYVWCYNV